MSASCYYSSRMVCATAKILFENYARAAIELFESADNLANLTGQHERFAEAMKYSKQAHEKCYAARVALDQHRAQHGCREGVVKELSPGTFRSELRLQVCMYKILANL